MHVSEISTGNFFKQVVKVMSRKVASPPHTDRSAVLARWRQCAPASNLRFHGPIVLVFWASYFEC